ncbi:hypothetical protein [Asticcacaulis solisilvae]|uniref:hypothetical protein n=1 Tax=Asticcacaulis solisilvae TaxID=1217274 RepID=UPI003FD6E8E3
MIRQSVPAALAAFAILAATGARAETHTYENLGTCVWQNVGQTEKDGFKAVYTASPTATDMKAPMQYLQSHDAVLQKAFFACNPTAGISETLRDGLIAAEAIQFGAAGELAASRHITREQLDQAWKDAPDDARRCALTRALVVYTGQKAQCDDLHVMVWFPKRFGLDLAAPADKADASQVLMFVIARAEQAWAEDLIMRQQRRG